MVPLVFLMSLFFILVVYFTQFCFWKDKQKTRSKIKIMTPEKLRSPY
jgi:hypothetical protein